MYTNIGSKIQKVAKIIAWIGIVLTVLIAAFMIYGGVNSYNMDMLVQGVVTLIIGPLACWDEDGDAGWGALSQTLWRHWEDDYKKRGRGVSV